MAADIKHMPRKFPHGCLDRYSTCVIQADHKSNDRQISQNFVSPCDSINQHQTNTLKVFGPQ